MQRQVVITIWIDDDHDAAVAVKGIPTVIVFRPPLQPGETSILLEIVNALLRLCKSEPIP